MNKELGHTFAIAKKYIYIKKKTKKNFIFYNVLFIRVPATNALKDLKYIFHPIFYC